MARTKTIMAIKMDLKTNKISLESPFFNTSETLLLLSKLLHALAIDIDNKNKMDKNDGDK